jgi:hypothetical protein
MKRAILLLLTAAAAFGAEDPWMKVRELKSGVELRIYKLNEQAPILAQLDQAGEESLIVITKNAQLSIPKQDIERIDYREARSQRRGKGVRVERKVAAKNAEVTNNTIPGATTSVATGIRFPSRAHFETIYRRTAAGK